MKLDKFIVQESIEEVVALVEVIYALLNCKGISLGQFESIRIAKAEEGGAFKKMLLLEDVITQ